MISNSKRPASLLVSLLLCLVAHTPARPAPGDGEKDNLVENGGAEQLDAAGALAGWSVYVREGKATLHQTTSEKVEGRAAARLEVSTGGAKFDVRTGRAMVPRLTGDAAYLFTADVKSEAAKGRRLAGYFCLGTENDLRVGHFRHNAGWQQVRVRITVPANGQIRRLELSGGCDGPAVILLDNVRLLPAGEGDTPEAVQDRHPLETAIRLEPGVPVRIRKILPVDCRLVRGFTHAPIDGRADTRTASGAVGEWIGIYGDPRIDYRIFNGNNGLHITVGEGCFNALQIRGGWRGRLYADIDTLTQPGADVRSLCDVRPSSGAFRRRFEEPVKARRLSFFYTDWEQAERGEPLADVTFLQVESGVTCTDRGDRVTLAPTGPAGVEGSLRQALSSRFGPEYRAYALGSGASERIVLRANEYVHFLTGPQEHGLGIDAVVVDAVVADGEPDALLTVRVQDVLDPRRECMGVDLLIPGPGAYSIGLDMPDQAFLLPEGRRAEDIHLGTPTAPPPVLWISVSAEAPMTLADTRVTLCRIPRVEALAEAGAWRKLLLRGLFATLSEPRPWMHLDNRTAVREQIDTKEAVRPYRLSMLELLENAEAARLLLPGDDVVRQYHEWLYQGLDRDEPVSRKDLPDVPGAPRWAALVRQTWREMAFIAGWWLDNRLVADGELGGNINDDTDFYQGFPCLPMIESAPLGARLKDAAARLSDLAWEWTLEEGINRRTMDGLHAYEEGINQVALCAWWFYGDPVHFERAMASARSVGRLLVETEDGRLHFGDRHVGIDQARRGYERLGPSPGVYNWAPERLLFHPVYVVTWYNRNPAALERFERWGRTWSNYQKKDAFVDKVDIPTGKPIEVTQLPATANIGPVTEWLALYQVTGDAKWHAPFKLGVDGGGYMGTTTEYGRMPHALVGWDEPYRTILREKFMGPERGYAGFFLSKDRSQLDYWLEKSVSWFGRFRVMHTAAEPKTDRVITHNATTAIACYLGDAPNRNRFLNFCAVSYEGLRGEDFAALVWDAGRDRLRVAVYNFRDEPRSGLMRVWRLEHGRYRVRYGPDVDDDGTLDAPVREEAMELQRYSPIPLELPSSQVTVVDIEQVECLDDILERTDLALSPIDTLLGEGGRLAVNVHNIGAKPARDVRVELIRGERVLESRTLEQIEAPYDLEPRIVSLVFDGSRPGDVVAVDPDDTIPEIAEHNNRLSVQPPSNEPPTVRSASSAATAR